MDRQEHNAISQMHVTANGATLDLPGNWWDSDLMRMELANGKQMWEHHCDELGRAISVHIAGCVKKRINGQ